MNDKVDQQRQMDELLVRSKTATTIFAAAVLCYMGVQLISTIKDYNEGLMSRSYELVALALNGATVLTLVVYFILARLHSRGGVKAGKAIYPYIMFLSIVVNAEMAAHAHLSGLMNSLTFLNAVMVFVVASWFLKPRHNLMVFIIGNVFLVSFLILESAGIIPYAPLISRNSGAIAELFLDWRMITMTLCIYACFAFVVVISVNRYHRVLRESTEQKEKALAELESEVGIRRAAEAEKQKTIIELQSALGRVKKLEGLLPICAKCKKVRDDQGYWRGIDLYLMENAGLLFTHSICPKCSEEICAGTGKNP